MRQATDEDVEELAHILADDADLKAHISDRVSEDLMETVYAVGINEEVDPDGIELSPEQESALVDVAVTGMFDALADFDASDIE